MEKIGSNNYSVIRFFVLPEAYVVSFDFYYSISLEECINRGLVS